MARGDRWGTPLANILEVGDTRSKDHIEWVLQYEDDKLRTVKESGPGDGFSLKKISSRYHKWPL